MVDLGKILNAGASPGEPKKRAAFRCRCVWSGEICFSAQIICMKVKKNCIFHTFITARVVQTGTVCEL